MTPGNKLKRPRASSNETDTDDTSFVKNVASKVSNLVPSTIARWFSPSSGTSNGSAPTVDATDSSTEDEGVDTIITEQPSAKRMRFNHFSPTDGNCSTSNIDRSEIPVNPYPGTEFSNSRSALTLSPIRIIKETIIKETIDETGREYSVYKNRKQISSSTSYSIAAKRKSIFDKTSHEIEQSTEPSTSIEKKPCFRPELLSSFYPGQTRYGGAASYMHQPNVRQNRVANIKDSKINEDSVISGSTRGVMDLLEKYSSPLIEARRIPRYNKKALADRAAPTENSDTTYKTQELHVPNIASIIKVKQKSRLMNTTKTARQIIASSNVIKTTTNPRIVTEKAEANKMTTKVKAHVTRIPRGMPNLLDVASPVKLPAATLQIDQNNLPKFSFDTPSDVPQTNEDVLTNKPEKAINNNVFTFSKPVRISSDTSDADNTPEFTFDNPKWSIEKNNNKCDSQRDVSSIVGKLTKTDDTISEPKDWLCPDCWVSNKADAAACVCCGYKTKKVKKCVVCKIADSHPPNEKCAHCLFVPSLSATKSQSLKWKCEDCWVMNEANVNKCACCGTVKPTAEEKAAKAADHKAIEAPKCGGCVEPVPLQTTTNSTSSFGKVDKIDSTFVTIAQAQKSDKWECSICLVSNYNDTSACVCCGTQKELKNLPESKKFNFNLKTNIQFKFGIDPKATANAASANNPEFKSSTESKLKDKSETNNNVLDKTFIKDAPKPHSDEPPKFSFGIPKDAPPLANKSTPVKVTDEDNEKPQEVPVVNFTSVTKEAPKPTEVLFASLLTQQAVKDKPLLPASNLFSTPKADAEKDITSAVVPVQPLTSNIDKPQGASPSPGQNAFTLGSLKLVPNNNLFGTPATGSSSVNLFTTPAQSTAATTSNSTVPSLLKSQTSAAPAGAAPLFSFGSPTSNPAATLPSTAVSTADKPNFQFKFGSNTSKPEPAPTASLLTTTNTQSPFSPKTTSSFGISGGNPLGSNNPLGGSNGLATSKGLTGNTLGTLGSNPLGSGTLGGNAMGVNTLGGNTVDGGLNGNGNNTLRKNLGNSFLVNSPSLSAFEGLPSCTTYINRMQADNTATSESGGNTAGGGLTGNGMSNNILEKNLSNTFTVNGPSVSTLASGLPGSAPDGNSMQADNTATSESANIFGIPMQKSNIWNANNTTENLFASNGPSNNVQKSATFSFSGTPSAVPDFNSMAQPTNNIFGMGNQNENSLPPLFPNTTQNQNPANHLFGSPQPVSNPNPQMGMFGIPTMGAPHTFGSHNPMVPSFETSMRPAPAAFNFGAPTPTTGIFGFGQQQTQQPLQQAGVYSFGGGPAPAAQVQFNMGTAPAGRRLRKAVRRATPR